MHTDWLMLFVLSAIAWPWAPTDPPAPRIPVEPDGDFLKLFQSPEKPPAHEDLLLPPTSAGLAWMTDPILFATPEPLFPRFAVGELGEIFDRQTNRPQPADWSSRTSLKGVALDPDQWRFRGDLSQDLYKRTVKVDVPNPDLVTQPAAGRTWTTEDRFQIPVPIALPIAEQMFVYGQFGGNGDTLNNRSTTLNGKTGVGMKWSPLGSTEVQLRYGTLLNYTDVFAATRFQERAQPALEFAAKMPLVGAWHLDYTGSALPAVQATVRDQIKQELRLAVPLGTGDNEFEFGARYRWDVIPSQSQSQSQAQTPWIDRAQLFMGLKFRR
ncbi:hypothetical protein [Zavarzinella formosa]|uniref:hypothetical protein n=1 Tax=Zavarzinella formosa TaxID=360055 RepID=UPI0002DBD9BF|nr:hypothetical protein [Zavarzinella formosa]